MLGYVVIAALAVFVLVTFLAQRKHRKSRFDVPPVTNRETMNRIVTRMNEFFERNPEHDVENRDAVFRYIADNEPSFTSDYHPVAREFYKDITDVVLGAQRWRRELEGLPLGTAVSMGGRSARFLETWGLLTKNTLWREFTFQQPTHFVVSHKQTEAK